MNARKLNVLFIIANSLLAAAIVGAMGFLIYRPPEPPVKPRDYVPPSGVAKQEPEELDKVPSSMDMARVYKTRGALFDAKVEEKPPAPANWELIELIQVTRNPKGEWEAYVSIPRNPDQFRARQNNKSKYQKKQVLVWIGHDKIELPVVAPPKIRPALAKTRVTVLAIDANSITLQDANGNQVVKNPKNSS